MPTEVLLTPAQESTIKSWAKCITTQGGDNYYHMPYILKDIGDGIYEYYKFEELPEEVQRQINGKINSDY